MDVRMAFFSLLLSARTPVRIGDLELPTMSMSMPRLSAAFSMFGIIPNTPMDPVMVVGSARMWLAAQEM